MTSYLEIKTLESGIGGHTDIAYWCVKFPWPLSNRDYVFYRRSLVREEGGVKQRFILSKAAQHPLAPEKSGVVRVDTLSSRFMILDDPEKAGSTKYFMLYQDDLKGSIPTSVVNWAFSSLVPDFVEKMRSACLKYASYSSKK
eukprot:TRINITY_DN1579_c0_g2_i1.p1 TRINITY_DN1579_c0_g2~~TRINITY_DN1579_c0_g2_i1.p1  ORF type:complete len:142 (+),score=13.03 TRINITY_DN1579_c0_g2_i1:591-1016(+)